MTNAKARRQRNSYPVASKLQRDNLIELSRQIEDIEGLSQLDVEIEDYQQEQDSCYCLDCEGTFCLCN